MEKVTERERNRERNRERQRRDHTHLTFITAYIVIIVLFYYWLFISLCLIYKLSCITGVCMCIGENRVEIGFSPLHGFRRPLAGSRRYHRDAYVQRLWIKLCLSWKFWKAAIRTLETLKYLQYVVDETKFENGSLWVYVNRRI